MKLVAVILAGGESRRYGTPKCLIEINGVPIVSILASQARQAGINDILVSGNATEILSKFGMQVIEDIHKGCGPMAGIHSAFTTSGADEVFILACDAPGVTSAEISSILEAAEDEPGAEVVFASSPSGNHPLCALVRRSLLPAIELALDSGSYGVNRLFTGSKHIAVHFDDEKPFININTQMDLEKWEEMQHG
jgi:molybdopterin-guanine dinucleotide biosynthesis protein A